MEFLPYIFDALMKPIEMKALNKRRKRLVEKASGRVLEIGAGTGVNFSYYVTDNIESLDVVDLKFNDIIKNHEFNKKISVNYVEGNAEKLAFESESFDCVVSTLILCSVDDPHIALGEVHRVLKPGGKIYFIEHVLPEKEIYKNTVNSFNKTWKKIGKCNVNRETLKNIEKAGFKTLDVERFGKGVLIFIAGIGLK